MGGFICRVPWRSAWSGSAGGLTKARRSPADLPARLRGLFDRLGMATRLSWRSDKSPKLCPAILRDTGAVMRSTGRGEGSLRDSRFILSKSLLLGARRLVADRHFPLAKGPRGRGRLKKGMGRLLFLRGALDLPDGGWSGGGWQASAGWQDWSERVINDRSTTRHCQDHTVTYLSPNSVYTSFVSNIPVANVGGPSPER